MPQNELVKFALCDQFPLQLNRFTALAIAEKLPDAFDSVECDIAEVRSNLSQSAVESPAERVPGGAAPNPGASTENFPFGWPGMCRQPFFGQLFIQASSS